MAGRYGSSSRSGSSAATGARNAAVACGILGRELSGSVRYGSRLRGPGRRGPCMVQELCLGGSVVYQNGSRGPESW